MPTALIIVPANSSHAGGFLASALDLRENVYGFQNTMIFKVAVAANLSVSFLPAIKPPKIFSNDFDECLKVPITFMVISHIGVIDGPIMSHAPFLQPWALDQLTRFLDTAGAAFWSKVGQGSNLVKIVLSGCESGRTYGQAVANAAGKSVYGFQDDIGSGIPSVLRPYIKTLEAGRTPHGMVKSERSTYVGPIIHPSPYATADAD